MAIVTSDIKIRYSTKSGSAGNSLTSSAAASLGKYMSTTEPTDASANNLFDDVSGDENTASDVEYRCIFVHNTHGTLALTSTVVWLSADVTGGANHALGVDPAAASAQASATAQAASAADESTAPSPTVTFTNYASGSALDIKARGLSVGDIPALSCRAIWVRRTAANSSALNSDGGTITVEGETAP